MSAHVAHADVDQLLRRLDTPDAVPRAAGELSFEHPWEVRALGLVVQLSGEGHFEWSEFRTALAAAVADWERTDDAERPPWSYYRCWLQAAERLVAAKRLATLDELNHRAEEFRSGKRTPPHTHGGGLLSRDLGSRAADDLDQHEPGAS